jgi:hypothetical protein
MTDVDAQLDRLWFQDQAPARDAAFRLAIMDRIARRRLRLDLVTYGALATGLGATSWALAPLLAEFGDRMSGGLAVAALAAAVAGLSLVGPLRSTFSRA